MKKIKEIMTRKLEVIEQVELIALITAIGALMFVLAIRNPLVTVSNIWLNVGMILMFIGVMASVSVVGDEFDERN